jgi:hypothetical protein
MVSWTRSSASEWFWQSQQAWFKSAGKSGSARSSKEAPLLGEALGSGDGIERFASE